MPAQLKWIALLRAVNVGGRKLIMADLKSLMEKAGYGNVRTLIASGNVVFESSVKPSRPAAAKIEGDLEAIIQTGAGLESAVMVRSPKEWTAILAANPFPRAAIDDPAHLYVMIMKGVPDLAVLRKYCDAWTGPEQATAVGREIFLNYPDGMGASKFQLPKKVGVGTARNWNTMQKIGAMLSD